MKQSRATKPPSVEAPPILEVLLKELGGRRAIVGGLRAGSQLNLDEWHPDSEFWLHDDKATVFAELEHISGFRTAGTMSLQSVLFAPVAGFTIKKISAGRSDIPLWFAFAMEEFEFESGERFTFVVSAHDFSSAASLVYTKKIGLDWLKGARTSDFAEARRASVWERRLSVEDELAHLASAVTEVLGDPSADSGADGGRPLRHHYWAAIDADGLACMAYGETRGAKESRLGKLRDKFLVDIEAQEFGIGINSPRGIHVIKLVDPSLDPDGEHSEDESASEREQRQLAVGLHSVPDATSWPFNPPGSLATKSTERLGNRVVVSPVVAPSGLFVSELARFVDGYIAADSERPDDSLMPTRVSQRDPGVVRRIISAARLSPKQSEAVEMYMETGSFASTGARMGVTKGSAQEHYKRGIQKLRAAGLDAETACLPRVPLKDEDTSDPSRMVESIELADAEDIQIGNLIPNDGLQQEAK